VSQVNVNEPPPGQPAPPPVTTDGTGYGFIVGIIVAILVIVLLIWLLVFNGGAPSNTTTTPVPSALRMLLRG
jgi:hypothetical protein